MGDSRARGWSGSLGLDVVLYAMSALCRIGDKDEAVGRGGGGSAFVCGV